jgi:hypothetical protein
MSIMPNLDVGFNICHQLIHTLTGEFGGKVGHTLNSFTKDVQSFIIECPKTSGLIVLIDTPGFNQNHLTDRDIFEQIKSWLSAT